MPYGHRGYYHKKKGSTIQKGKSRTTTSSTTTKKKPVSGIIQVVHTFPTSSPLPQPSGNTTGGTPNLEQQKLIRETYKKCLESAALSGKFMTSVQRQSLLTAISTEVGLQPPPGLQASSPTAGLPNSPNQSMTTDELASLLRLKALISGSGSPPSLPSSAIST